MISIQDFKAEALGISYDINYTNFEILQNDDVNKTILVCTDKRRIQQILLNLVSNALKFSKSGSFVKISLKYISCVQDLTFQEESEFIKVVNRARHGVLEIQVEDKGIGIKEKDLAKMF